MQWFQAALHQHAERKEAVGVIRSFDLSIFHLFCFGFCRASSVKEAIGQSVLRAWYLTNNVTSDWKSRESRTRAS